MEDSVNKKLALIWIMRVLEKYSDVDHPLRQEEIAAYLFKDYGLKLERKAIGRNIALLKTARYDIQNNASGCWLAERDFENSELRLLIDGVLSSKHIAEQYSEALIEKLCKQTNIYFRAHIKNIYSVGDWSRTNNREVFYNIDIIDEAIEKGKQLKFSYNRFGDDKKLHKTAAHTVSPYQLILSNQRYYLMAFNEFWKEIVYYRIDRITGIEIIEEPATNLKTIKGYESGIDYQRISSSLPYMFSDDPVRVEFIAEDTIIDQIVDWFGYEVEVEPFTNGKHKVAVTVSPNAMEYWAMQYLNYVEIITPVSLRDKIKENLMQATKKYQQ